MNSPIFSVVVLAWNVEKYIEECLISIDNQTFMNFEVIIVVPDGEDRSAEICEIFSKKHDRFKTVRTENYGQNRNRLIGWKHANGEYMLCIDGDDKWHPELLQKVYDGIISTNADLVIFGHERFAEGSVISKISGRFLNESVFCNEGKIQVYEKYLQGGPINEIWAKAWSRKHLKAVESEINTHPDIRKSEDLLLSCIITDIAEKILYIDECLYCYRIHSESITRTFCEQEVKDYLYVKDRILDYTCRWGLNDKNHIDVVLDSIAKYVADWIFRCEMSDLGQPQKQELYRWLEEEYSLYPEIKNRLRTILIKQNVKPFVNLFLRNKKMLRLYAAMYKTVKRRVRH